MDEDSGELVLIHYSKCFVGGWTDMGSLVLALALDLCSMLDEFATRT